MTTPAVTIAARADSRWRCGVEHTSTPRPWPAGSWTEEQLDQLIADPMLTVVETDAVPPAPGEPVAPPDQLTVEDAIAAATAVLVLGRDDKSWMKDGRPQVKALEAALGFDITAAQRDAAWQALQDEGSDADA